MMIEHKSAGRHYHAWAGCNEIGWATLKVAELDDNLDDRRVLFDITFRELVHDWLDDHTPPAYFQKPGVTDRKIAGMFIHAKAESVARDLEHLAKQIRKRASDSRLQDWIDHPIPTPDEVLGKD